jgi:hypothetical protein
MTTQVLQSAHWIGASNENKSWTGFDIMVGVQMLAQCGEHLCLQNVDNGELKLARLVTPFR